jgi:protein-S-isoprenylcysteine O-methyltransferase Ste14
MGMEGSGGRKSDAGSWTTVLALVGQLGFSIACPMVLFIGGGAWLDNRLGWGSWFLFVGILLGVATAAGLFYQIAKLPTRKRTWKSAAAPEAPYKVEQQGGIKDSDLGEPPEGRANGNGH